MAISSPHFISLELETDNTFRHHREIGSSPGCWRRKIVGGKIITLNDHAFERVPAKEGTTQGEAQGAVTMQRVLSVQPFAGMTDGWILTAAALWSPFDNALERLAGCRFSFNRTGGDTVKYQYKMEEWLLWHLVTLTRVFAMDGPVSLKLL